MAGGINRIQFNPAAQPVDTVGIDPNFQRMAAPVDTSPQRVAPTAPTPIAKPADNTGNAAALISALSSFAGVAKSFLDERDERQQKADMVEGQFYALNHSDQQSWQKALEADATLASKSPWFKKGLSESLATNAVSKRLGQLQAEYVTSGIASSTDPDAIQKWYMDRMKETLDQYTDPDSRRAALEAAKAGAAKFAANHTQNATANLIQEKNRVGNQQFAETLDAYSTAPGVSPASRNREPIALKDATPEQLAFLEATSSGESPGYNIRFGGAKGNLNFDINGPHPGIGEEIHFGPNKGKKSTASGKYQFIIGTWKGVWGGVNQYMTPENQDRAALWLAERDYKDRTGRNIWEDIKAGGFNRQIQAVLAPTWESFGKGQDRRTALFNSVLKQGGGKVSDAPTANPEYDEMQTKLYATRDARIASGEDSKTVTAGLVQTVINKAYMSLDPNYLGILDQPDAKGVKLSSDPEVQKQIIAAKDHVYQLTTRRDAQKAALQEKQEKAQRERLKSAFYVAQENAFQSIAKGEQVKDESGNVNADGTFSSKAIADAAKIHSSLAEKMIAMNKSLTDRTQTEDPHSLVDAQTRLYSGDILVADVPDLIASGVLKSPQTISKFYEQARQNQTQSFLNSAVYRDAMSDINDVLGDPMNIDMEKAKNKVEAKGEVRTRYIEWMRDNPKATPMQQSQFLFETTKAVLGDKADIEAWKAQKKAKPELAAPPTPGKEQPKPAPAPGTSAPVREAQAVPAPSRDVDTTNKFVWGSLNELEGAFSLWRQNPSRPGPFNHWLEAQGITDQKQAVRWYLQQKALAGTQR
ncbi:hypothetical protein AB6806_23880 [Bosea sp. RCC_152_1]|uniref:hypothetical protein n=1 Tax=Bosea sp. RCC_152_1 TaxID=3239228 RepID=UPI00352369A1